MIKGIISLFAVCALVVASATAETVVLVSDTFTNDAASVNGLLVENPQNPGDTWWGQNSASVSGGKLELAGGFSKASLPFTNQTGLITLSWEMTLDGSQPSWTDGKAAFYGGFGYETTSDGGRYKDNNLSYGFNIKAIDSNLWTGTNVTMGAGAGPYKNDINDYSIEWTRPSTNDLWQGYFAVSYNVYTYESEYFFSTVSRDDALANGSLGTVTGAELVPPKNDWDGLSVEQAWFKTDFFEADEGFLLDNVMVTLFPMNDTNGIPPTVPQDLTAEVLSDDQVLLSWSASTDDVAVAGYNIYRNGVLVASKGNVLSYMDSGLTPETSYSYTVSAVDRGNNESAESSPAVVTTLEPVLVSDSFTYNAGNLGNRLVENPQSESDAWYGAGNASVGNGKLELGGSFSKAGMPFTNQHDKVTLSWEMTMDGDQASWGDGKAEFYGGFGYATTNNAGRYNENSLSYGFRVRADFLWTGTSVTIQAGDGPSKNGLGEYSIEWTRAAGELWQGYFAVSYDRSTTNSEFFFSTISREDALANGSLGTVAGAELVPPVNEWDGLSVEQAWFKSDNLEADEGFLLDNVVVTYGDGAGTPQGFDAFVITHGLSGDRTADKDGDGLMDYGEYVFGGDPDDGGTGDVGEQPMFVGSTGDYTFKLIGDDSVTAHVLTNLNLISGTWGTNATVHVSATDGLLGGYTNDVGTANEQLFIKLLVE